MHICTADKRANPKDLLQTKLVESFILKNK